MQNIYSQATARVHLGKLVSDEFPIHRGVRQGVNVDGENLTNLKFADDVVLFSKTSKQMEKYLNSLNSDSLKVGLKNTQRKDKVPDKL